MSRCRNDGTSGKTGTSGQSGQRGFLAAPGPRSKTGLAALAAALALGVALAGPTIAQAQVVPFPEPAPPLGGMLGETLGPPSPLPTVSPAELIEEIRRLETALKAAESQQERERIEGQLRRLRGSSDYFLQDATLSAYRAYQPPVPTDGLVHYEVSRQIATTAGAACGACGCNCGGTCRRGCGCPHPWRTGPGWCDDWCVGPHWEVSLDGLLLRRENFDVGALEGVFGAAAAPVEQFHYEAGARGYATGRGIMGYDVQLGYVGVDVWRGYASFLPVGVGQQDVEYRTGFHSGELNIFPQAYAPWRLFTGVRYFELDEDFWVRDVAADLEDSSHVENQMIGFQVGLRRELWYFTEWAYFEALVNGGIYRNRIDRFQRSGTITGGTTVTSQVEYNDVAFLGEASLTAVARLHRCLALRGGYQVLFVDGVTTAQDAFLSSANQTESLVYHGAHVGLEYRR